MKVGDILVDEAGNEREVLAYLEQGGGIVALSDWGDGEDLETFGDWYTLREVEENEWKLKGENGLVEKTVGELETELGLKAGSLRVKK